MNAVSITTLSTLQQAYDGSFYTISGVDGIVDYVEGYEKLMQDAGIGVPNDWYQTTGAAINLFAGENGDPYPLDLTVLLFPLDGLDVGKLAMFKIHMGDRWFDDIIDNMRRR